MPAQPELQRALHEWTKRINFVQNQGVSPGAVTELAKQDIQHVEQTGSSRYGTVQEASDAVYAAYRNQARVAAPGKGSGLLDLFGNAGSDIGNIVNEFIPSVVHMGMDLTNTSKWGQQIKLMTDAHAKQAAGQEEEYQGQFAGKSDLNPFDWNWGAAFRNLSKEPLARYLPGMWTGSSSMQEKMQHPVMSLLDVVPFIDAGVSAGSSMSMGAEEAARVAEVAKVAKKAGFYGLGPEGRAAVSPDLVKAALVEGHPLKALAQHLGVTERTATWFAQHWQGAPPNMAVWKMLGGVGRRQEYGYRNIVKGLKDSGIIEKGLSEQEVAQLAHDATHYQTRYEVPSVEVHDVGQLYDLQQLPETKPGNPYDVPQGHLRLFRGEDPERPMATISGGGGTPGNNWTHSYRFAKSHAGPSGRVLYHDVPVDEAYTWGISEEAGAGAQTVEHMVEGQRKARISGVDPEVYDYGSAPNVEVARAQAQVYEDKPTVRPNKDAGKNPEIKAYVRSDGIVGDTAQLSLTPSSGLETVRVRLSDINLDTMTTKTSNMLPDRTYSPGEVSKLAKTREWINKNGEKHASQPGYRYSAKEGKVVETAPFLAKVPNGKGGFEYIDAGSDVGVSYNSWQRAVKRVHTYEEKVHSLLEADLFQSGNISMKTSSQLLKLQERSQEAVRTADRLEKVYHEKFVKHPSARHIPALGEMLKAKSIQEVTGGAISAWKVQYHGENLRAMAEGLDASIQETVMRISDTKTTAELNQVLGKKTYEAVYEDTIHDWSGQIEKGFDPIWLHHVDPRSYEAIQKGHISILPDRLSGNFKPGFVRNKAFDFAPAIQDMQVAITDIARQEMRAEGTRLQLETMMNMGVLERRSNVMLEIRKSLTEKGVQPGPGKVIDHLVEAEYNNTHTDFHPGDYRIPGLNLNSKEVWSMPKVIKRGFDQLIEKDHLVPAHGIWDKTMGVWRFSVLTGPRHLVHVGVGGMMMLMGDSPDALMDVKAGLNMLKAHREGTLNPEVAAGVFKGHYIDSPDAMHGLRAAHTGGRMMLEHWKQQGISAADGLSRLESNMSNMQRAMVYARDIRKGVDSETAMNHINRVFVDMDNLSPFERTTLRQFFPFWVFTKHIMRYVLAYPADHPVRAAILSRAVNQFEKDWATGMPKRFMQLFFLGEPDKNGNIASIDMRNLNPFRSMYSVFTMQGFLQGANPAASLGAKALGVNPLTSTPELFNGLHYDDFTGSLQANRPSIGIGDVASSVIPEFSAVDHFIGLTDQMRRLKKYSPEAYRRQLLSSMNIPFTYSTTNVYDARASAETNRYRAAQKVVTQAWQTGNTTELERWQLVPWQGQLVDSGVLSDYIKRYVKAAPPGISPKAIYKPVRQKKSKRVL